MRLQSFIEIVGAYAGVDDGEYDKDHSDDRECSQRLSNRRISTFVRWLVHAYEFE